MQWIVVNILLYIFIFCGTNFLVILLTSRKQHPEKRFCFCRLWSTFLRWPGLRAQPLQCQERRSGVLQESASCILRGKRKWPEQRGAEPWSPGRPAGWQGSVGFKFTGTESDSARGFISSIHSEGVFSLHKCMFSMGDYAENSAMQSVSWIVFA